MTPPRLVYLVNEDSYFVGHRLTMARAALKAGYDVHVATRLGKYRDAIVAEGFKVHPIDIHRGSVNPLKFVSATRAVRKLYRALNPTIVHHVTLQATMVGALAARNLPVSQVNTVTGLGTVFTAKSAKTLVTRAGVGLLIGPLLNNPRSIVTVENPDDKSVLASLSVESDRIHVLPGSGIDIARFSVLPEPPPPVTVAFAGRMLIDKGVRTLVAAYQIVQQQGHPVRLVLAGVPDPANDNSIPTSELEEWAQRPGITWLGQVADIRDVWRNAHIAVLASLGEGLPMSLVEAAACGRALIATDVPGSRAVARTGLNGILVPTNDPQKLAEAIIKLASDADMRRTYAEASRSLVETEYSSAHVESEVMRVYELARRTAPA